MVALPERKRVLIAIFFSLIFPFSWAFCETKLSDEMPPDTETQTDTSDVPESTDDVGEPAHGTERLLQQRDTLTDNWFGFGKTLEEHGITVALGLTQIYQINLQGGGAPNSWGEVSGMHRRKGRYTGSYDWETEFDLEKLLKIPGATVFAHVEGGWSQGLGNSSIGSIFDVNGDAYGDEVINLTELYWEQTFFNDRLKFRIGKMDITGGYTCRHCDVAFDTNAYANDETFQFLNSALVNNPTIPFPDYGLGASLFMEPIDRVYFSAGVADARADARETGFKTTFHGQDHFFAIFETGVVPVIDAPWGKLPGGYRVGFWYDPQGKDRFRRDGEIRSVTRKRDDMGFYLSFDQALYRENEQDEQGLGVFARYGWADRDVNDLTCFWSAGFVYQGLVPRRDNDVLGVGYANGKRGKNPDFDAHREQLWEFYYSVELTPWLHITPNLQYLKHPGLNRDIADAVVAGVRAQLDF